ncbi:MAG TPA: helix-turn-helix domain-containing protein [Acidimicrobiales bacterium]|nr:helix-turn-helix domain-containing protein [Acidimicrobiales bacterium]
MEAGFAAAHTQSGQESTRDRLLDAAIDVFREKGYDGAGVQEIARRAGLTTGAIYANFRGKTDLLFSAIDARSGPEFDDLLRGSREPLGASDLLAELGSHLLDRDERSQARGGLLIEATVAARRDSDVARLVRGLLDERLEALGQLIDQARAEGSIAPELSTDAVSRFCLLLALGSLIYTSIGFDDPEPGDWDAVIRRVVASFDEVG